MRRILSISACLLLLSGVFVSSLPGQATSGGVTGTVRSTTGSTLTDVKIELENVSSGARMTATTDSSGSYRFENVPPGRYRLITTSGRLASVPSAEFEVAANRMNSMNITVAPGPATDVITMIEEPVRSMDTAQLTTYFTTDTIVHASRPNLAGPNGNLFGAYNLSLMSPNVTSGGIGEAAALSVTGHRPVENLYHIDGIDNKNYFDNNRLAYVSNMATNDFVVLQNQSSPRFGHEAGAQLNSTVRTGSNGIHGAFYDYFQNRNLNAMEPAWKGAGLNDIPRYDQNRLGGNVGLPVWKDKVFFYGGMEYIPFGFTQYSTQNTLAPTAAGYAALAGLPGISQSNLSLLQSNLSTTQASTQSVMVGNMAIPVAPSARPIRGFKNSYMGTGAIDFNISERQKLQLRYVHNKLDEGMPNGGTFNAATNSFFPANSTALVASVSHTYTIANIINELRGGYNRFDQTLDPSTASFFANPNIQIGGAVNFLSPMNYASANKSVQDTFNLADTVAVRFAGHNIRLGYDGRRTRLSQYGLNGFRGNYLYSSLQQFLFDQAPASAQQAFGPSSAFSNEQWSHFAFLQDTWTLRPNLTVDVGLSYQYATIPQAIDRLWGDTTGPTAAGQFANGAGTGFFNGAMKRPGNETLALAPKVGVAWAPGNRGTVIRAGLGAQYDTMQLGLIRPTMFPFAFTGLGNPTQPGAFLANNGLANPYASLSSFQMSPAQTAGLDSSILGTQRLPYYMRWNVAVQQSGWHGFVTEVQYTGTKGVNLPWMTNMNMLGTATGSLPVFATAPTQAELNALPVTLNQLLAGNGSSSLAGNPLYTLSNTGNSMYHAVSFKVSQRFVRGFQLTGAYTYSHLIDDSNGTVLDLGNPMRERGNSLFDRRHRATATVLWDVASAFKDQGSVVRNIIANLTMAANYTYESPQRLPVVGSLFGNSFATPALVNYQGSAYSTGAATQLTNSAGQVVGYLNSGNSNFVNGALGAYSTGARAFTFPLDTTNNVDFSVAKGFGWRDLANFEVRGTAYNVFNTAQYVGRTINSVDFPAILTTPSILSTGSAGFQGYRQTLGANARTLQLSLRVMF